MTSHKFSPPLKQGDQKASEQLLPLVYLDVRELFSATGQDVAATPPDGRPLRQSVRMKLKRLTEKLMLDKNVEVLFRSQISIQILLCLFVQFCMLADLNQRFRYEFVSSCGDYRRRGSNRNVWCVCRLLVQHDRLTSQ